MAGFWERHLDAERGLAGAPVVMLIASFDSRGVIYDVMEISAVTPGLAAREAAKRARGWIRYARANGDDVVAARVYQLPRSGAGVAADFPGGAPFIYEVK